MGNKRNRRSRRLGTPSPQKDSSETQVETSNQDNDVLIDVDSNIQGNFKTNDLFWFYRKKTEIKLNRKSQKLKPEVDKLPLIQMTAIVRTLASK